jgi:hypothetical protein
MVGIAPTHESLTGLNAAPNYVINVHGPTSQMSVVTSTQESGASPNTAVSASGMITVQSGTFDLQSPPEEVIMPPARGEKSFVKLEKVVGTRITSPCWTSGSVKSIAVSKAGLKLIETETGE